MMQSSGFGSVDGNGESMYEPHIDECDIADGDSPVVTIFAGEDDPLGV